MKTDLPTRHWLLLLVGVIFIAYCLFQARFLILGPQVWIETPQDGEVVYESTVVIVGSARNTAWISLNDRQIFTDTEGRWSEKLIVAQGLSIMKVQVRDRFGREREKSVRILFN